jgi:hypothetical protein
MRRNQSSPGHTTLLINQCIIIADHLLHYSTVIFQHTSPAHCCIYPPSWHKFKKLCRFRNRGLVFVRNSRTATSTFPSLLYWQTHTLCCSMDSTVMRKWKWLFVNHCECKIPISNATRMCNALRWDKYISVLCDMLLNGTIWVGWISYMQIFNNFSFYDL